MKNPNFMSLSGKNILKIFSALPLVALLFTGCAAPDYNAVMAPPDPKDIPGLSGALFHNGDTVFVSFDGLPENPAPQDKTIGEDGNITLTQDITVKAAGKTTGELEKIIHDAYVPKIYKHLTVTVKAGERVFYVRGEVAQKSRQVYVGQITVTKAIAAAGDFTDFANRKNVLLIRSNGQRFVLNCDAILRGELPDPPVYPGDQIEVKRRRF
jgi:polysaccharide export outer membrane protein